MSITKIVYILFCSAALLYLAGANARGYVPFVTSTSLGSGGGATTHFHK